MFKRLLFLMLGVFILLNGCSKKENEVFYEGKLISNEGEDFLQGEMENIMLNEDNEITLVDGELEGEYISPIINTNKFRELVASWNVDTPQGTDIEISYQVKVEDEWSMWFSYGKWSSNKDGKSKSDQRDKMANMAIDTLEVL